MDHEWRLVIATGEDAPNQSRDEIWWCCKCGTVKHEYAHNGGHTSPNYPVYFVPGQGPTPNSQQCDQKKTVLTTSDLIKVAGLVYPILLAQEAGEISESKAAELLGKDIVSLREIKLQAIKAIVAMLEQLPSPLSLLLESMKGQQK